MTARVRPLVARTLRAVRLEGPAIAILALAVGLTLAGGWGALPKMRDMAGLMLPRCLFWRDEVFAGELPQWNPLLALGAPVLVSAVYPGNLPLLLGSPSAGVFATWALHLFFGGIGGYAVARRMGCRPESALVSGLVWCVGGYVASMWWNGEKTLAYAWLPWLVFGTQGAVAEPRAFGRRVAFAGVAACMIAIAGDPFFLFDAALLAAPCAVLAAPTQTRAPDIAKNVGLAMAASFALGLLLAAPLLLPATMLRGETARALPFARETAEAWSLHPVRWLELFVPNALGDPLAPATYAGAPYADDAYVQVLPWSVSVYAGAGTLALAVLAPARRARIAFGLVAALGLGAALGRHAPIHAMLRALVPPLQFSRYPEKHVVVVCAALGLLASLGAEALLRKEAKLGRFALVAGVGLALALAFAPAPLRATTTRGALHAGVALSALGLSVLAARRASKLVWLVPAVIALDLALAARPLFAWMPPDALSPPPMARALATERRGWPPRIFRPSHDDFEIVATLPDNAANLFGVAALPGFEQSIDPALHEVVGHFGADGGRALDFLRVDAVVVPAPAEPSGWRLVRRSPPPRAWMVGRAAAAGRGNVAERIGQPAFDTAAEALVDAQTVDAADLVSLASAPPGFLGACALLSFQSSALSLACDAPRDALLVVAEDAGRGWEASVDGAAYRPVSRVDLVYRGVVLPPGHHDVRLRYERPWFFEGALLAVLGALLAALGIARDARRAKERDHLTSKT